MLGKVIKYDFRANGRLLWPLFALAIGVCGLMRTLLLIVPHIWKPVAQVIEGVATTLGVLMPICIFLLAFIYVVVRFYQTMMTGEAYLTFTLPVNTSTHIIARLIVGTLYTLIAGLVTIACVFIMLLPHSTQALGELFSGEYISVGVFFGFVGVFAGFLLVAIVNGLLHLYASMGIGAQFGRHRVAGSVIAYFVLNAISSVVSLVLMALPVFSIFQNEAQFMSSIGIIGGADGPTSVYVANSALVAEQALRLTGLMLAIFGGIILIISVLFYIVTWYTFDRKLNLE